MMPASRLRILHVVYNLIHGGTEGQCARTVLEMAKRGHFQRVAVTRREGCHVEAVERVAGCVFETGICKMLSLKTLRGVRGLARYVRRERIGVVHCWDADAAIFGGIAARLAGRPYITSRRDLGQIYPAWKLRLMRWADGGARAVVVNADAIRKKLVAAGLPAAKLFAVPNMLDVAEFDRLAAEPFPIESRLPAGRRMVMVSRFDPEKDFGVAVEAFGRLAPRHKDVSLVLAGDGRERGAVERRVHEMGLSDRVVFPGDITEVPSLLRLCHVGLLTPRANEGLSNSILEYMAAGLPVVATDCGGNGELVKDGKTGFLALARDAGAIAGAVEKLLLDPDKARAMGARGRRRAAERYRPDVVAGALERLYASVARGS
ncbi:MAG: glycosyltransferase [Kiritimatiellae bacterium]|nr:glycosyltransferase [Kiritimatiellia bacterium]